jgi:hypothetical protein
MPEDMQRLSDDPDPKSLQRHTTALSLGKNPQKSGFD